VQRQPFDSGYIQRLAESDPETVDDFIRHFSPLLAAKVRRRAFSGERVEEATQETFRRVLAAVRTACIEDSQALGSFVLGTCDNVLSETFRRDIREGGNLSDNMISRTPLPDAILLTEEHCALVRRIVDEMPERDRIAIKLFYFEEQDKDEICRTLGVSRENLRLVLFRARERFEKQWKKKS
jgi:RNA polymerase sigma-70 factor (ECF subfamily)